MGSSSGCTSELLVLESTVISRSFRSHLWLHRSPAHHLWCQREAQKPVCQIIWNNCTGEPKSAPVSPGKSKSSFTWVWIYPKAAAGRGNPGLRLETAGPCPPSKGWCLLFPSSARRRWSGRAGALSTPQSCQHSLCMPWAGTEMCEERQQKPELCRDSCQRLDESNRGCWLFPGWAHEGAAQLSKCLQRQRQAWASTWEGNESLFEGIR